MNTGKGFTLIELMYTLAVAGFLVGIGVPGFVDTIRNSRMTTSANTIVSALHMARSEAVKRRGRVTVCRAALGNAPDCDANGTGYAVFVNAADDLSIDGGDEVLRAGLWLRDGIDVVYDDLPAYVTYAASGFTRAIGGGVLNGSLVLCDTRGDVSAHVLSVSVTGRPQIRAHGQVQNAASCS